MTYEATGKLHRKYDTQQVSEKFKKRTFVIELAEEINGNIYTQYPQMQFVQNKCDLLDKFNVGDQVKVSFNIKGNAWQKDGKESFITNLDAWRIEVVSQTTPPNHTTSAQTTPVNNTQSQNAGYVDTINYNAAVGGSADTSDLPFRHRSPRIDS